LELQGKNEHQRALSPEKIEQVRQLRAQGVGLKVLAYKFGVSRNAILRYLGRKA